MRRASSVPNVGSGSPSGSRPSTTKSLFVEARVVPNTRIRPSGSTTIPRPSSSSKPAAIGMTSFPSPEKPASKEPSAPRAMIPMSWVLELPVRPTV